MSDHLAQAVHSPADVANYTLEVVESRLKNRQLALTTGVGTLDRFMKPVLPGEVIVVQANTGQGKTSFMQIWARSVVKQLQAREGVNEFVCYITYETLVEEMGLYDLAALTGIDSSEAWHGHITDDQYQELVHAAMKRSAMPLWVIGRSMKRKRQYDLPLSKVQQALHKLEDEKGLKPAIIFLDYIQTVPAEGDYKDRRLAVIDVADRIKELAVTCGCPVVAGAQAKVDVFNKDGNKIPGTYDAQESSRVAQDADKVISLWYPKATEGEGATVDLNGTPITVTKDLMVIAIRKQRHAEAGFIFPVSFDPARSTMVSWSERVPIEEAMF